MKTINTRNHGELEQLLEIFEIKWWKQKKDSNIDLLKLKNEFNKNIFITYNDNFEIDNNSSKSIVYSFDEFLENEENEMEKQNLKLVTCWNCWSVLAHELSFEWELKCKKCWYEDEQCHFPDLNY